MHKFYIIIYPVPQYIEEDLGIKRYVSFVRQYTGNNLLSIIKEKFNKVLEDKRRDGYKIVFYIPTNSQVSSVFKVREEDLVVYDELSVNDLLYSTNEYSSFNNLIEELRKYNISKIVISGFHMNDCVEKCYNALSKVFKENSISKDTDISDITLDNIVKMQIQTAFNNFVRSVKIGIT